MPPPIPVRHAEQDGRDRIEPERERFLSPGDSEQRQPGAVKHKHRTAQLIDALIP